MSTQLTIHTNNENILSVSQDFTQDFAIFKRGTKQEDTKPNPYSKNKQLEIIENIIGNTYNVIDEQGKEKILLVIKDKTLYIERNFKNFKEVLISFVNDVITTDGFEVINLPKLFEIIKTRASYSFREYRSPFFKKNEIIFDEKSRALIRHVKIDYLHDLEGISKEMYIDITTSIDSHWGNKISSILDFIVASIYATDKKNLWLLIMAPSNFGKSKLFDWMKDWDGAGFIDFKDIIGKGINDRKPEDYYNKLCLVIDEAMSFHRELFKIEDSLSIRPMRQHTVYVPINARILLSADGGSFNDDFLDKQITNRVSCINLRNSIGKGDLGDLEISKKYGKNKIKRVMSHYLNIEVVKKIDFYEGIGKNERADEAEKVINIFFEDNKMEKVDFFSHVEQIMQDVLFKPEKTLGDRFWNEIQEYVILDFVYKRENGYILKNPNTVLKRILKFVDESMSYELEYKKAKQIAEAISGWSYGKFSYEGATISGIFIPKCPF